MKLLLFLIVSLFMYAAVSAQVHTKSKYVILNNNKEKVQAHLWLDTGVLQTRDFDNFDYVDYVKQMDSLQQVSIRNDFKRKLFSIDSSIAVNRKIKLDIPELSFLITYAADGSVDTCIITLYDTRTFKESENLDPIIQEMNLANLQAALQNAKVPYRDIHKLLPMQVDQVRKDFDAMHGEANNDNTLYAEALLKYIHKLLTDYKTKLGISDANIYETSFEPANLNTDDRISRREKFIRYVYSKIG